MYTTTRFELKKGTEFSAGYDLPIVDENVKINPGVNIINTGIRVSIPNGHYGKIEMRSSAGKKGLVVLGGVIDVDYRGEIKVMVFNLTNETYNYNQGDKISQLIIIKNYNDNMVKVDILDETNRGERGFGSTGS